MNIEHERCHNRIDGINLEIKFYVLATNKRLAGWRRVRREGYIMRMEMRWKTKRFLQRIVWYFSSSLLRRYG